MGAKWEVLVWPVCLGYAIALVPVHTIKKKKTRPDGGWNVG